MVEAIFFVSFQTPHHHVAKELRRNKLVNFEISFSLDRFKNSRTYFCATPKYPLRIETPTTVQISTTCLDWSLYHHGQCTVPPTKSS